MAKISNKIEYGVVTTHPRFVQQTNKLLEEAKKAGQVIIGLEVIDKTLLEKLDINIDPQHSGIEKRNDTSAIDYVFQHIEDLIKQTNNRDVLLVTSRADLDSVGAMAILTMALNQELTTDNISEVKERVKKINIYDNYMSTAKWEPKSTVEEALKTNEEFGPMNLMVADPKVSLATRVKTMETWLTNATEPQEYLTAYNQEIEMIINDVNSGKTTITPKVADKVVVVESTLAKVFEIGYTFAPGVIAYNPKFDPNKTGIPQLKFSIAQFPGANILKLNDIKEKLNKSDLYVKEGNEWGGPLNLLASPFNTGTGLSPEAVIEVVLGGLIDTSSE